MQRQAHLIEGEGAIVHISSFGKQLGFGGGLDVPQWNLPQRHLAVDVRECGSLPSQLREDVVHAGTVPGLMLMPMDEGHSLQPRALSVGWTGSHGGKLKPRMQFSSQQACHMHKTAAKGKPCRQQHTLGIHSQWSSMNCR